METADPVVVAAEEKNYELVRVTSQSMSSFVTLIRSIFPVNYSDSFYKECLDNDYCQVVMHNGTVIAVVAVRPDCDNYFGNVLYVKSLGVHPMFRNRGIGTRLVQYIYQKCRDENRTRVMLHVQVNNQTAIDFYEKLGFSSDLLIKNYYARCVPSAALIMIKNL